nr:MAG TPA: putative dual-specificity RNA methyltransferase [Caudoviricetes sp.]
MKIKNIIDEDFVNYKKASMFIGTCYCDWKCCKEANIPISTCQNYQLSSAFKREISIETLIDRYLRNPITNAIVVGGLEPMLQFQDIKELILCLRNNGCMDDFVIYTGYYENELEEQIRWFQENTENVIVKFGRYVPKRESHFDDLLGIYLASENQYAKKIC